MDKKWHPISDHSCNYLSMAWSHYIPTGNMANNATRQQFFNRFEAMRIFPLPHKQLEAHWCVINTVAPNALVLKHWAISMISILSADKTFVILYQFHKNILFTGDDIETKTICWKKWHSYLGVDNITDDKLKFYNSNSCVSKLSK